MQIPSWVQNRSLLSEYEFSDGLFLIKMPLWPRWLAARPMTGRSKVRNRLCAFFEKKENPWHDSAFRS